MTIIVWPDGAIEPINEVLAPAAYTAGAREATEHERETYQAWLDSLD